MAARLSRKRLPRYTLGFKLGAVKLSEMPGVEVAYDDAVIPILAAASSLRP